MRLDILSQCTAEYSLLPRVVACGVPFRYTARGLGVETAFVPDEAYTVRIIPQEEIATARTLINGDVGCYDELQVTADTAGTLCFSLSLPKEQIYTLRLLKGDARLADLKVYCAGQDLWQRTPMRGNTHCHSCFSVDGHEDPVVAAAYYRRAGYDYLAITDHHKIDGSVYAIEHMRHIPTEMALYYGEEVHVPDAYIHAVNVGALLEGGVGLDAWYHAHKAQVDSQVDAIAAAAAQMLPPDLEPYDYAWRKWIADTIHQNGGIAIAAHPFWEYDANNTRNAMLRYIAETGMFDAMEVVHGQENPALAEANRQEAFWQEMRADGVFIPVVGVDDAHRRCFAWNYGCDFNNAYTVIFARDSAFTGFAEAIRGGYSAAVEGYGGAPEHVVGTYRLTNFTRFLLEEYFPGHDELCFEEGCRMRDAYLGSSEALAVLQLLHGRVKRYTDAFFGR